MFFSSALYIGAWIGYSGTAAHKTQLYIYKFYVESIFPPVD